MRTKRSYDGLILIPENEKDRKLLLKMLRTRYHKISALWKKPKWVVFSATGALYAYYTGEIH